MRVLVVDNNPATSLMVAEILDEAFENIDHISVVIHADDAISLIKGAAEPYDAALISFDLKVMTGIDIFKVIRSDNKNKDCHVIMMSNKDAENKENIIEECKKNHVDALIEKPFTVNQLKSVFIKKENDGDKTPTGSQGENSPGSSHSAN